VKSGAVIEGLDVIEDGGAGGEAMMIDQFVFEAAKERLDEGVIVAVVLPTKKCLDISWDANQHQRSHSDYQ
jgi:hypothetical protein